MTRLWYKIWSISETVIILHKKYIQNAVINVRSCYPTIVPTHELDLIIKIKDSSKICKLADYLKNDITHKINSSVEIKNPCNFSITEFENLL